MTDKSFRDISYGRHEWRYVYDDLTNPSTELVFRNKHFCTTDIVQEFANYLLGCGFHQSNVIEAFEDYAAENRPVMINAGRRFAGTDNLHSFLNDAQLHADIGAGK